MRTAAAAVLLAACSGNGPGREPHAGAPGAEGRSPVEGKVVKTDEEWRAALTPEQYRVARRGGTEPAFTGAYWETKKKGVYKCACCGQPLFRSDTKYRSGTGWPSFWKPVDPRSVSTAPDRSLGTERTEVKCSRCDAHLGHVFEDGPEPTGRRYCVNSASLELDAEE